MEAAVSATKKPKGKESGPSISGTSSKARSSTIVLKPRTAEDMLDGALEYIQASSDFWENGDVDNAIDALDQAYSLLLKIDPHVEEDLIQQRDDLRITISKRIIEIYSSRYTVANGFSNAIPLVMNRHVERALQALKGPERNFFINAYRRSGAYRPAIVQALKEAGLPEEISWLPLIESGFKPRALSPARALGMWQFIASTGYKYGLVRDTWIDERMDPEKSTRAAIAYLRELHQIFGDWSTVLASYNCGENRVLHCIQTQKINYLDNFWDLYEKLPQETASYFPRFLAVLHILKDPASHGFELPAVDRPVATEEVRVDKHVQLKSLGEVMSVSAELLEDLNPELRRSFTPDRPYNFKVPKGQGPLLLAKLNEIPSWTPSTTTQLVHRVKKGETLFSVARKYGASSQDIAEANNIKGKGPLKVGSTLKIPTFAASSRSGQSKEPPRPAPAVAAKQPQTADYVVVKGDSLLKIAQRFDTTTKAILSANGLKEGRLSVGQVLKVPTRASAPDRSSKTTKKYVVSKGDSLFNIAQRHQMSLSEFLRLNKLSPRSTIFPGQVVLVRPH